MRLLIHDFGGYAFIVQLAAWLAAQGHEVLHLRAEGVEGPQAGSAPMAAAPDCLRFGTVGLGRPFAKYALHRRVRDEAQYGLRLGRAIGAFAPDVVLSANTPPLAQAFALRGARRAGAAYVNWVQDIFTLGAGAVAGRMPGLAARLAVGALRRLEFASMAQADAVAVITPDFVHRLAEQGVRHPLTLVQENWAPLPDGPPAADRKGWARDRGLGEGTLFLAAGTLGLKHDPGLLADLAASLDGTDARLAVVSQGLGRERLEGERQGRGLRRLHLLDYQPAALVPAMLAAAEVGVVILGRQAAGMCVPSKVYTYAAAGLPILAAVPADNHAARLIRDQGLGLVVEPDDRAGFAAAALRLATEPGLRAGFAAAGRAFAAAHCDMGRIGPRFGALLQAACQRAAARAPGLPAPRARVVQ